MISGAMPLVVLATAVAALSHPPSFSWFQKQYYAPALGGIMLSIGVQLSVADFALVFRKPTPVLVSLTGLVWSDCGAKAFAFASQFSKCPELIVHAGVLCTLQ